MASEGTGGAGRRLGRYHLGEILGGGPTGVVYQAKVFGVAGFERRFAIKRFHDELVRSPSMAAKIAGAARVYGSLEHPNLARLHEFGVAGGQTFTATELVDGIDLQYLSAAIHGGVKPGSAAAALALAARAVGFGHGRGHCHLGICPTNILLSAEGQLKVSDFGLLPPRLPKRPAQDPTLDARIPYLAPEQLAGEPTSAATDVYQLGVIGYILFVGEPPFSAPSAFEVAQQIMSAQAPEPVLARPVAKVLKRCLARSPFERYPDASALADAIDEAAHQAALPGSMTELQRLVESEYRRRMEMAPEDRRMPEAAPPQAKMSAHGPAGPKRVVRGGVSPAALKKTMMGVTPRPVLKSPRPSMASKNPMARTLDSQAETKISPAPLDGLARAGDSGSIGLGPAGTPASAAHTAAPGGASGVSPIPEEIELGKSNRFLAQPDPTATPDPDDEIIYVDPGSARPTTNNDSALEAAIMMEAPDPEEFETELYDKPPVQTPTELTLPPVSNSPIVAPPRPIEPDRGRLRTPPPRPAPAQASPPVRPPPQRPPAPPPLINTAAPIPLSGSGAGGPPATPASRQGKSPYPPGPVI